MSVFYETEEFSKHKVPIRVLFHNYVNEPVFTIAHWHRNIEFDLTIKGNAIHYIDGESVQCGPNEFCIINSGTIHSNRSAAGCKQIQVITLQIGADLVHQWIGKNLYFFVPEDPTERKNYSDLLRKIASEYEKDEGYHDLMMMGLLFDLMQMMSRFCRKKDSESVSQKEGTERLKKLLDHIDENHEKELSLKHLADTFGYSPEYLSRAFKKHIGCNFFDYLQTVRLIAAVADMREYPQRSIAECCLDHGFPNVKSFIHSFKKTYGMTPSDWRRQIASADRNGEGA